jgi:phenylacetate-CoA ligase
MFHDWKMAVYWRLPVPLQELALSFYAGHLDRLYYGPDYDKWRQEFIRWRTWSRAEIEAWQSEQLRYVVELAATRVPYYRHAWRGLEWKAVRSVAGLTELPRLEKQAIRQNEQAFLVDGMHRGSLWLEKTSGTTGTSLRIYWPHAMLPKWWALSEVMVRHVAGVAQDIPRAMMGGRPVVPGGATCAPYWRFNRRWRQLYLSSYHVSMNTAADYVTAIRRRGCEWMTGYGSAIAALAESASAAKIAPLPLRAVITSGDTLLAGMRRSIEKFFRCKCFDHYGQAEGVCMAMECLHGRMHVVWPAGILEITREDGSSCGLGEIGEIVATGLLNDAMPLVRYRLGDYATWAEDQSCSCGNASPIIIDLEGRVDDYLVTGDGRKIGRLSTAIKRSPTIHSAQIVQDRPNHAYLLVRPSDGYRSSHAAAVRADILERIGHFDLEVVEVAEIPKTPRGKVALVVQLAGQPEMQGVYARVLKA